MAKMKRGTERLLLLGGALAAGLAYLRYGRPASARAAVGDQVVVAATALQGAPIVLGGPNAVVTVSGVSGDVFSGSVSGFIDAAGNPQALPAAVPGATFSRASITGIVSGGKVQT